MMRWISSLSFDLPGTMIDLAKAPSLVSRRSRALRAFSSGPWQAKQFSDRMGRICRLKSTLGLASTLGPSAWLVRMSTQADRDSRIQNNRCQTMASMAGGPLRKRIPQAGSEFYFTEGGNTRG